MTNFITFAVNIIREYKTRVKERKKKKMLKETNRKGKSRKLAPN